MSMSLGFFASLFFLLISRSFSPGGKNNRDALQFTKRGTVEVVGGR